MYYWAWSERCIPGLGLGGGILGLGARWIGKDILGPGLGGVF